VAERIAKPTRATVVASDLRDDILSGRLRPGERLVFPDLCGRYDASVGAIREALVALVGQGLVKAQPHQGYEVTPLSHDELLGLTQARLWIEPLVLRDAIQNGDLSWEGRVVNTHHIMDRTPRDDEDDESREAWAAAHAEFHAALFSGSTNRRMLGIVTGFDKEAALYRRWSMPFETHRDVAGEHRGIMEAALARDSDLAVNRLASHISLTTDLLIEHAHEIVAPRTVAATETSVAGGERSRRQRSST
jgi:DNA-binding GntR family transcriptional regulator